MPSPILCVDCEVEITTQDALADQVVQDDEGFHHRECADGGSPIRPASAEEIAVAEREGDLTPKQIEEEDERRAEMGDPPLPEATDCPECHAEPAIEGGRGFLCRGRSML